MKARRRRELKENVLAHELGKVKEFLNKHGNWILVAVTAVLIVVLVVWYYHKRSRDRLDSERARLEQLTGVTDVEVQERLAGLVELAENAKDPTTGASAAVFAGNLCLQTFLSARDRGSEQEGRDWLDKAEGYFSLAIEKYPNLQRLGAHAHFGLGTAAENRGDMKAAQAEYEQVRRLVSSAYPVAREAEYRLRNLEVWSRPVKFATTTQATQPATAPTTATAPAATRPAAADPAASRPATSPAGATPPG